MIKGRYSGRGERAKRILKSGTLADVAQGQEAPEAKPGQKADRPEAWEAAGAIAPAEKPENAESAARPETESAAKAKKAARAGRPKDAGAAKGAQTDRRPEKRDLMRALKQKRLQTCRTDFYEFCRYMDDSFFTDGKPHLKLIARALQGIAEGDIRALAVSMPPRAGKSYVTSLFCAWMLGRDPMGSIMRNSYAAQLAEKFSKDIRDGIIQSPKYRRVFPNVSINRKNASVEAWSLSQSSQPSYFCAGVGGAITGFGCRTIAILDDPIKNIEEALSETVIENVWNWYTSTHLSRLESGCPEIHIATRWSKKDPIGRLTDPDSEYYRPEMKVIKIPAVSKGGRSFCEEIKTAEEYREIRRLTDNYIWNAEYMQEPVEEKGLLFPKESLKRFKMREIEGKTPDGVIGYCDTADRGSDYLSAPIGYRFGDYTYITDVVFTQDGAEVTEPLIAGKIKEHKLSIMKIEANNGGSFFARNVRRLIAGGRYCQILSEPETKNKETRILMAAGYIKEYFYFREDYAAGGDYDLFMRQLTGYLKPGGNRHDDAADSLTGLAEMARVKRFPKKKAAAHYNFDFEKPRDDDSALGGEPDESYIKFIGG